MPSQDLQVRVRALLEDAEQVQDRYEKQQAGRFHRLITSDYESVFAALQELPVEGTQFLEWGSGLGAIAMMASLLGYEAHGIEINPQFVQLSYQLAERHAIPVEFACGTFFPDGFGEDPELLDEQLMHNSEGADAYRELGMDLSDFDLTYAFPWPGEEELFLDLFHRGAARGARMLINYGSDGFDLIRNNR